MKIKHIPHDYIDNEDEYDGLDRFSDKPKIKKVRYKNETKDYK